MADFNTYKQRYYVVTAEEETTIVDTETGKTLAVVPAKTQQVIQAIGSKISASADCVVLPFDKALSLNTVGGQTKSKEVLTAAQTYRLDYADGKTLIDLGGSTYNGYLCYNHTGIKDVTVKGTQNSTSMAYAWYGCNQLDHVTFTDTPEAGQDMTYTFRGCTSLTSLAGLSVDDEGYQVIKCSASPDYLFYNCPKLSGKYKIEIEGALQGNSYVFMGAANTAPTTGDLDIILSPSKNLARMLRFALNHPNLHDVTIQGVLGFGNSSATNAETYAFGACKNLNKVTLIHPAVAFSGNNFSSSSDQYMSYTFSSSGLREFVADWSMTTNDSTAYGLLCRSTFNACNRLRRIKGVHKNDIRKFIISRLDRVFNGCTNLTQINAVLKSPTLGDNAFTGCKLDLPSVQFIAEHSEDAAQALTLGISRYKLAYDTNTSYFEAGEVKYTADDKIWYLAADGTETTDTAEAALNDYITTDPAEGSYGAGGYYAKGALKEALDTLTGKGYVLTVEYN